MHQRISTTLKTLRQDLATGLGGDFIVKACRAAGHTWSDSCFDSGGHHSLVPRSDLPRQHRLAPCLTVGWPRLHRVRILSGTCRTPAGRLSGGPPRNGQGPDSCHREGGTCRGYRTFLEDGSAFSMPDTPELPPLRPARWTGQRLRLPHSPHPSAVPRRDRAPPGGHRAGPLRSHDMAGVLGILPLLMAGDVLGG